MQQQEKRQPKLLASPGRQGKPRVPAWGWLLVALFWFAVWQAAYLWIDQEIILASPWQVFRRFFYLIGQAGFWQTTFNSLARIMGGFLLGLVTGTILAVATVQVKAVYALFYPLISGIRATPVSSFIILALIWMTSNRVVIFIVFLMVLPIVWANVAEGIRKTDLNLLEMATVFRFRRSQLIRFIYLPSVSPFFMTAAITSLGLGWKAGIAAEVLSTPRLSLGGRLYEAKIYLETIDLMTFTAVVIVLSLILEKLLVRILRQAEGYFQQHGHGRR